MTGQVSQLSSLLQVVRKWRSLALRLGLSEYILDIDCWRGGASGTSGTTRRRRGSREKDKMELFMKVWRETKPEMYTVTNLKTLLSAEVKISLILSFSLLILTDKVAACGKKMYFSEHKTLPAAHYGQVLGLIWTKLQEGIFWTYCVVNRCFLGNLIFFMHLCFYLRPLKHLKLTK